jgi:hypothetical protein
MKLLSSFANITCFCLMLGCGLSKSGPSEKILSRSDDEVYASMFGEPESQCGKILSVIDSIQNSASVVWLRLETCPSELNRIVNQYDYNFARVLTANWTQKLPLGENIDWTNPQQLGDTILVFEFPNTIFIQTLWTSSDSTKVFCRRLYK